MQVQKKLRTKIDYMLTVKKAYAPLLNNENLFVIFGSTQHNYICYIQVEITTFRTDTIFCRKVNQLLWELHSSHILSFNRTTFIRNFESTGHICAQTYRHKIFPAVGPLEKYNFLAWSDVFFRHFQQNLMPIIYEKQIFLS